MKIIFLDFDGVLNTDDFINKVLIEQHQNDCRDVAPHLLIIPNKIEILNEIIAKTNTNIVVSSTWRKLHDLNVLRNIFKRLNCIGEIIDVTPIIKADPNDLWPRWIRRGDEIDKWFKDHIKEIESFVIVDDIDDFYEDQRIRFVQTDCNEGLVEKHIEQIIEILNIKIFEDD